MACYNKVMLKTIYYSIVCFSNKIIEMEEAKKKKEPMELKNKDLLFSCVDSQIEIKKNLSKSF